jgi:DNA polymerase III alpha subunit
MIATMIKKFENGFIDDVGRMIFDVDYIFERLLNGECIDGFLTEESFDTERYNYYSKLYNFAGLTLYNNEIKSVLNNKYDEIHSSVWFTPKEYSDINIREWLINHCKNDIERERVDYEIQLYEERNLLPLLKHLIFLVNHFRKNNIVWGVGRGSSVSSYILYLIGIHKVDSIKYNLDVKEFLK